MTVTLKLSKKIGRGFGGISTSEKQKHAANDFSENVVRNMEGGAMLTPADVIKLRPFIAKYSTSIKNFQRLTHWQDTFNYCLCDPHTPFDLENFINVLRKYEVHVKVNFSFAVILRNVGNGEPEFRYFHSSKNNAVELDVAFRISTYADIGEFQELFEQGN